MSMEETGTGHGIKIKHERDDGLMQVVEAHYNETGTNRLTLIIDGVEVYLSMGETGFFLAWMAEWYEQGGD